MKDFLKDELSIYEKFSSYISGVFTKIRYGIAPCKNKCCEELEVIRFELLRWQQLADEYEFFTSLYAGPDRTFQLPGVPPALSATYRSMTLPLAILWTQTSGEPVTIDSPSSLNSTITGMTVDGSYEFEISVTNSDGSILTDSVVITALTASQTIQWGYIITNPYANIVAGNPFALQFARSVGISDSTYPDLDFTDLANNTYLVLREPSSATVKTSWNNTAFNFGTIPDQVFLAPVVVGQYRYYISRNPVFLGIGTTQITFS